MDFRGPDPDRAGFPGNPGISNRDVVTSGREFPACIPAHRDVAAAGGVVMECLVSNGSVSISLGGRVKAGHTYRRVLASSSRCGKGVSADRRVVVAFGQQFQSSPA